MGVLAIGAGNYNGCPWFWQKQAKQLLAEHQLDNTYLQLDEAIQIVDKIIDDGFKTV